MIVKWTIQTHFVKYIGDLKKITKLLYSSSNNEKLDISLVIKAKLYSFSTKYQSKWNILYIFIYHKVRKIYLYLLSRLSL